MQNLVKRKEEAVRMLDARISWRWKIVAKEDDGSGSRILFHRSKYMVAGQVMLVLLVYHGGGQDCYQGKTGIC